MVTVAKLAPERRVQVCKACDNEIFQNRDLLLLLQVFISQPLYIMEPLMIDCEGGQWTLSARHSALGGAALPNLVKMTLISTLDSFILNSIAATILINLSNH